MMLTRPGARGRANSCCCWQVKRLIKGGGVYLNNAKVTEQDKVVQAADLIEGKLLLLAAGKKNKMLVRISS